MLVPEDVRRSPLYESAILSAFADWIDVPTARAKIPFVPASVGPVEDALQRSVCSDFTEAPIAATFLPFAGSSNDDPVLPGAINERDHGIANAQASKSPVLAV